MADVPILQIQLLGEFRVDVGTRPIPAHAWRRRKAAAMVKLLALAPQHRLHREQVLERLWPELDAVSARNNLNRTLHDARRLLQPDLGAGSPPDYLRFSNDRLVLSPSGSIVVDAVAFEAAAAEALTSDDLAAYRCALDRYTGELLPEDRYEDWTIAHRERLRLRRLELLLGQARLLRRHGHTEAAISILRRAIEAEPAHDGAYRDLFHAYLEEGRHGEALRVYQQLRDVLLTELGIEPDEPLQRLSASIARRIGAASLPAVAVTTEPSLPRTSALSGVPLHPTSFVGRESALAELPRLLGVTRLLTLIGPGGSGKSRLAAEVANVLVSSFPDGIFWVDLAPIVDETSVPEELARLLGVPMEQGQTALDILCTALRTRHTLIVLDNCEHLVETCARLADALLRAAPDCRILATSRIALNAPGEHRWTVPSLATPGDLRFPMERLQDYAAVRLFLDRAQAIRHDVALTEVNAPAIAHICQRLEGLPLAIELAAARVGVLAPTEIATRLDDCLDLLSYGRRTSATRHQTLRGVLDWSYHLLSSAEQAVLRRLSVFAGGWTIEAAEAVCGESGGERDERIARNSVLNHLASLIDQSLVVVEGVDGMRRYRYLEPIRQYASEKLLEAGEEHLARDRHLTWAVDFAGCSGARETGEASWLDRLAAEHDNGRAALRWILEREKATEGFRLAGAYWRFWLTRGYLREGRAILEALLERFKEARDAEPTEARATALLGAGVIAYTQGDQKGAEPLLIDALTCWRRLGETGGIAHSLEHLATVAQNLGDRARAMTLINESLTLRRAIGEPVGIAASLHRVGSLARELGRYRRAYEAFDESLRIYRGRGNVKGMATVLNTLGKTVRDQGDYARAIALHEESLALSRELGDVWGIARSLDLLGVVCWYRGEAERAATFHEQSLALSRELGDRWAIAGGLIYLAYAALTLGDEQRALALFVEGLDLCRALGDSWAEALAHHGLGRVALAAGDWDNAAVQFREALLLARRMSIPWGVARYLEGAALVAIGRGEAKEGALLLGGAAALRETLGIPLPPPERADYDRGVAAARATLDTEKFDALWAKGRSLRQRRLIGEALALMDSRADASERRGDRGLGKNASLTRRQSEIAMLVGRGLTNRAIAAKLRIAERTVDTHVANIFGKLGLRSRAELAACAAHLDLDTGAARSSPSPTAASSPSK